MRKRFAARCCRNSDFVDGLMAKLDR